KTLLAFPAHLTRRPQAGRRQDEAAPVRKGEAWPGVKRALGTRCPGVFGAMLGQALAQEPTQVTVGKPLLLQALNLNGEIPRLALAIRRILPGLQKEAKGRPKRDAECLGEAMDRTESYFQG